MGRYHYRDASQLVVLRSSVSQAKLAPQQTKFDIKTNFWYILEDVRCTSRSLRFLNRFPHVFIWKLHEPNLLICKLIIEILDYSQSLRLFSSSIAIESIDSLVESKQSEHFDPEDRFSVLPCDQILINKLLR